MNEFINSTKTIYTSESEEETMKLGLGIRTSVKRIFEIDAVTNKIVNGVTDMIKHGVESYISDIHYYLYQPMYSNIGAAICDYLIMLDEKQFMKIADTWMREKKKDSWFMKPYCIFFKRVAPATYVLARSIMDKDGGVAISLMIIGKELYPQIALETAFESRLLNCSKNCGRPIMQHNIYYTKKDNALSSTSESIKSRSLETIFMNNTKKKHLITFLDTWMDSKEAYDNVNVLYKIGILLYGKPGTGKTSLVKALSTKYNIPIININATDIANANSANELKNLINSIEPGMKIVLLEDIDVAMSLDRNNLFNKDDRNGMNILMQILDGAASLENTIYIATTNHKETLDEAVIRYGRFDMKIEMNDIERPIAEDMCKSFGVNPDEVLSDESFPINPAYLQSKLFKKNFDKIESLKGKFKLDL